MTTATLFGTEDASAFQAQCDRVTMLLEADKRRAVEFLPAYEVLKSAGAVFTTAPLELGGGLIWYSAPHPRFVDLYESLRLRARLDLPVGQVAA